MTSHVEAANSSPEQAPPATFVAPPEDCCSSAQRLSASGDKRDESLTLLQTENATLRALVVELLEKNQRLRQRLLTAQ